MAWIRWSSWKMPSHRWQMTILVPMLAIVAAWTIWLTALVALIILVPSVLVLIETWPRPSGLILMSLFFVSMPISAMTTAALYAPRRKRSTALVWGAALTAYSWLYVTRLVEPGSSVGMEQIVVTAVGGLFVMAWLHSIKPVDWWDIDRLADGLRSRWRRLVDMLREY